METTRILLIDDHEVVRDGLQRMLELEDDLEVVGEASDAQQAMQQVELHSPEVILMDIQMPGTDGLELTRQLKEKHPDCNIIMLTLYDEYLTEAIEAGAVGYLLKDIKREELVRAIRSVREGRSPLDLSVSRDYFSRLAGKSGGNGKQQLTDRETTILKLVAEGVTTRELAEQLFLSQASVKRSIGIIFDKMRVRNRSEAVSEAHKRRMI